MLLSINVRQDVNFLSVTYFTAATAIFPEHEQQTPAPPCVCGAGWALRSSPAAGAWSGSASLLCPPVPALTVRLELNALRWKPWSERVQRPLPRSCGQGCPVHAASWAQCREALPVPWAGLITPRCVPWSSACRDHLLICAVRPGGGLRRTPRLGFTLTLTSCTT